MRSGGLCVVLGHSDTLTRHYFEWRMSNSMTAAAHIFERRNANSMMSMTLAPRGSGLSSSAHDTVLRATRVFRLRRGLTISQIFGRHTCGSGESQVTLSFEAFKMRAKRLRERPIAHGRRYFQEQPALVYETFGDQAYLFPAFQVAILERALFAILQDPCLSRPSAPCDSACL